MSLKFTEFEKINKTSAVPARPQGGLVLLDYRAFSDCIKIEHDTGGRYHFILTNCSTFIKPGDLVLKWSEEGNKKSIHRIVEMSGKGYDVNGGREKVYRGVMVDLMYINRMSTTEARALKAVDPTAIKKEALDDI